MRHILRDKRETGLAYAASLPPTLLIEHSASRQRWFLPLTWRNGAASSAWKLPVGAKRGDYSLRLLHQSDRRTARASNLNIWKASIPARSVSAISGCR
jgi:hypothetical protein